jgi:hypothetical protein
MDTLKTLAKDAQMKLATIVLFGVACGKNLCSDEKSLLLEGRLGFIRFRLAS